MSVSVNPDIVTDGLVLCLDAANPESYPGSGNTWYDLSSEKSNFELHNGAFWDSNTLSISFDGDNDNAGRSTPTSLQLRNDKTLAFWFNDNSGVGDNLASLIRVGLGADLLYCFFCESSNKRLAFHWYNNAFATVYSQLNIYVLDRFNYGCISMNGTTVKFYMNGVPVGVSTVSIPSPSAASLIGIGATRSGSSVGTTGQDLGGQIAVAKIYNRALSENEIHKNYNATKGRYGL
jgi:hypothetical protein